MKLLLDTHIWIWNLAGSERLPEYFRETINQNKTEVWLSPISIWETLILAEKGKLKLEPDSFVWVREALKRWPVKEAPINNNISIKSREIDLPHQDPADRFISATALIYDLSVMTLDERLLSAPWLPTVDPVK